MSKYSSKTQSKNGGRRRKQTKRKLRRARKSRKVMRGGAPEEKVYFDFDKLLKILITNNMVEDFLLRYRKNNDNPPEVLNPDSFVKHYNNIWNQGDPDMMYQMNRTDLEMGLGITDRQVLKEKKSKDLTIQGLKRIISSLPP